MLKKLGLLILLLIVGLLGVIGYNTAINNPADNTVAAISLPETDKMAAAERLSTAIQFRTISHSREAPVAIEEFEKLHRFIELEYPNVALKLASLK